MSSYCCGAVALYVIHVIILKTLVLSRVHQSSLPGNGHSFPSAIKSSPLAPLSWFFFFQNYPRLLCSYRLLPSRCLLFYFLNHTFDWVVTKSRLKYLWSVNHLIPWEESLSLLTSLSSWFYQHLLLLVDFNFNWFFFCFLIFSLPFASRALLWMSEHVFSLPCSILNSNLAVITLASKSCHSYLLTIMCF